MSHIVDAIEVTGTLLVKHVLPLTTDYFQWIRFVEQLTGFTGRRRRLFSF